MAYSEIERRNRNAASFRWKQRNPDAVRAQQIRHQKRPTSAARRKRYQARLRQEVLSAYSSGVPKCACCGESEIKFLAVDHIKGGGSAHRKENRITSGTAMYCWLRKMNFPAGFQILCHNCNIAKGLYGVCPHQNST